MEIISRAEARKRGLKRYFLGPAKPCPHGHIAERLTSNGTCVVCTRAKADKWAAEVSGTIKPCKYGHNSVRTTNGACLECELFSDRKERAEHPERGRERNRRHYAKNGDGRRQQRRDYYSSNQEKESAANKARQKANPDKARAADKRRHQKDRERYHTDPAFRALLLAEKAAWDAANPVARRARQRRSYANRKGLLSNRLERSLRNAVAGVLNGGRRKAGSFVKDLGCTVPQVIAYIESQFRDGMSWSNWSSVWELDHVIPIGAADLTIRSEFLIVAHYTNLQPLLIDEHRRKSREDLKLIRMRKRGMVSRS